MRAAGRGARLRGEAGEGVVREGLDDGATLLRCHGGEHRWMIDPDYVLRGGSESCLPRRSPTGYVGFVREHATQKIRVGFSGGFSWSELGFRKRVPHGRRERELPMELEIQHELVWIVEPRRLIEQGGKYSPSLLNDKTRQRR